MKKFKLIITFVLVASLVFSFSFYGGAANVWDSDYLTQQDTTVQDNSTNTFEIVAENNDIKLYVNKNSGCFYIENDKTGSKWYSNPQNITDADATGMYQMEAQSLLLFNTYNEKDAMIEKSNSEALGVRSGIASFKTLNNGFVITYTFTDYNVSIPLEITLTDKGFRAVINIRNIIENGELMAVSLLPYFHAGTKDEDGYLVLPDGSGSLLYFNNGRTTAPEYNVPVYGRDITSASVTKPQDAYGANLPVFGIKKDNASFLAVIDEGAAQASIHASTNGKNTSYANCYSEFILRGSDTIVLGEETGQPQSYQIYQRDNIDLDTIAIDYLLFSEQVDYNLMAGAYREYLIEKYKLEEISVKDVEIYLDFYGAINKQKQFLGIPVTVNEKLSEPDKIKKIVDEISNCGIKSTNIILKEWTKAQLSQKADNGLKSALGFGSLKKIVELNSFLNKNGGNLFLEFNISKAARSGNGVSVYRNIIHNISNMPAGLYTFKHNTLVKDKSALRQYYLNINIQQKLLKKIYEALDEAGFNNVAFGSFDVYSDYTNNSVSRESNLNTIKKMLEGLSTKSVASEYPADYIFSSVKTALNTPVESNKYSITDCSIPFYQLAVSGLLQCVGEPLNLSADYNLSFLKALETGSALHYSFITADNEKVIGTDIDWLYSADFEIWKDELIKAYTIFTDLKNITESTRIISHIQLKKNVYKIVYENNSSVYINYNESEYVIDGEVIPPEWYRFRGKDGDWK